MEFFDYRSGCKGESVRNVPVPDRGVGQGAEIFLVGLLCMGGRFSGEADTAVEGWADVLGQTRRSSVSGFVRGRGLEPGLLLFPWRGPFDFAQGRPQGPLFHREEPGCGRPTIDW